MQKKLIALAVAGLASAPAFAQSNVTIYGVADVTLENVRASGCADPGCVNIDGRQRVSSNSSLIGFRGSEALGNGLNAIFQFEQGVNVDQTGGTFATRDSFVGLQGSSWGTLSLGNHTGPYRALGAAMDLNPGATGITFNGALFAAVGGLDTGLDNRLANSVRYLSPSWGGFSVGAIYGANEGKARVGQGTTAERTPSDDTYGVGLTYAGGPLYVGYAYERRNDKHAVNSAAALAPIFGAATSITDDKITGHRAGIKYTFAGAFTIGALYDRQKIEARGFPGAVFVPGTDFSGEIKRDVWGLIAGWTGGPHAANIQYTAARKTKGSLGCEGAPPGVSCDDKANMWTAAYYYSFSKRTMLKAYYAQIKNKDDANYDFFLGIRPIGTTTAVGTLTASGLPDGADPRGFGVGFRHVF